MHVSRAEIARKGKVAKGFANENGRGSPMERFIQRQNVALFKKKLADPKTGETERQVILKLLADEEAKEIPQKK